MKNVGLTVSGNRYEIKLEDEFADFQNDYVVYHDDISDYSTNEPTMDGTAGSMIMMSYLERRKTNDERGMTKDERRKMNTKPEPRRSRARRRQT